MSNRRKEMCIRDRFLQAIDVRIGVQVIAAQPGHTLYDNGVHPSLCGGLCDLPQSGPVRGLSLIHIFHFESNAVTGETPLSTAELCVLTSELLSRACGDAALYDGERNIHFAAFPGEDTLTMEVVYSGELPQKAPFDWKGKTLSQTLAWLFEEGQEDDSLHGLENAREIVGRYSGKLSLSGTSGEVIIHLSLRF